MNTTQRKTSGGAIVALCALVYFVSYFARKDFAAIMASMIKDEIITKPQGGFIGMGLFIAYGAGQLVSGYLGDKLRPRTLLIAGLATTMLANLAMPLLPNTTLMIPVWAINGFAQAMLWPPIVRILADNLDHDRFVTANLIVTMAAHVSTILLYLYVPLCLQIASWETVFFTASIITAVTLTIFVISMFFVTLDRGVTARQTQASETYATGAKQESFLALFARVGLIPIFFAIIAMGFLRDGIESWLPTLYGEAFGRTASESILVSAILPVFSILSVTLIKIAHKTKLFSNESRGSAVLFLSAAALCVPLAVLINFEQSALRLVCLILAALICGTMHAINFLYISCLPGRFAAYGKAATASGFCNAFTYVGAAISMYGISALAENLGWSATAISWIGVAGLGLLFSLVALKKYTAFLKKAN